MKIRLYQIKLLIIKLNSYHQYPKRPLLYDQILDPNIIYYSIVKTLRAKLQA